VSVFPDTRVSLVEALSSDDQATRARAVELVVQAYRAPVIAVLSRQWSLDLPDAEDLAHDFFAHALEREWLARYDATRGRFRTFLRTILQAYASTANESRRRQKRGGHLTSVSLESAPPLATEPEIDRLFETEWVRSVMSMALDRLRQQAESAGRATTYAVFVAHDIEGADADPPPRYADLAERFSLPLTQVANYLHWARTRFRQHVIDTLRSLTTSDAEFREEARALLGIDVP
jgi:DNA-directed RNA polymerase specialized sigma24 family protein